MLSTIVNDIDFRAARADDLAKIIELVEGHDEDDAEDIVESLQACEFKDHYVALLDNTVVGITGFKQQPDCDRTFYLSWTYLHPDHCGKGYGNALMTYVLERLKEENARKVFIKISDYVDPEDGPVYEAAMKLYKKFGFEEEIKFQDYYDTDESMFILGLALQPNLGESPKKSENPKLKFTGMFPIQETEHSYSFSWEEVKWWQGSMSVGDVNIGLDAAYDDGAHQVFLSFPATFTKIQQTLLTAGFEIVGNLKDYYEDGIDELHFLFSFKKSN